MGEVYRARDSRLGRDVAVKILPVHFTQDSERLRRFEQEARAAGMLNHPNILAVHDVGNFDGMPYVVSELLEGETLRSRLHAASLPYRKSIDYALQIARGLAEAHEKGIVHRDLKPENIYLTKEGRVKILDFGLAKLTNASPVEAGQSHLPTEAGTEAGVVLGTVGYMSPEQVRGLPVDARSDIFSFGAILYEMLTGKRAFRGDSAVETMNAILKQEPEDLGAMTTDISPAIERILKHCLEKNPEERFQSVSDLAFALETVSNVSASTIVPHARLGAPSKKFRALIIVLLAIPLLLLILWGVKFLSRPEQKDAPSYKRLTFRRGTIFNARFAPDGQTIVYGAAWEGAPSEIFQTRKDSYESRSIDLRDANVLSISKSGEMLMLLRRRFRLGFMSDGTLARMPLSGGAPREILENVTDADWHPTNGEIAVVTRMSQIEFPPGKILHESDGWISQIRFSPDGGRIGFTHHPRTGDNAGFVSIYDFSGKARDLTSRFSAVNGLSWSPDGKELWFSATEKGIRYQIYAVDMDGNVRAITAFPGHLLLHDISQRGELLLSLFDPRRGVIAFPEGAPHEIDLSWFEWSFATDLSDDGKQILLTEQGEGAGESYAIYLRNTDGSPAVRLGSGWGMALSRDKKEVLVISYPDSSRISILPTGAGNARDLPKHVDEYEWVIFSRRPDEIIFTGRKGKGGTGLFVQKISDGTVRKITPDEVGLPYVVSPDGAKVAAVRQTDQSVWIYPVDGGEPQPLNQPGYFAIQWSEDGSSLYLTQFTDLPAQVFKYDLKKNELTLWKVLTPEDSAGITSIGPIQITPDGKSYSYTYRRELTDLYIASNLN